MKGGKHAAGSFDYVNSITNIREIEAADAAMADGAGAREGSGKRNLRR
jgi:hypothetical protein